MNDARQFGAIGDGTTNDTQAIQRAIDAGGMVRLPPGTYLTGTLYLKSNGGLFIEPGATLLGSPNLEDYNAPDFCPQNWASKVEVTSGGHLIVALEQENITITGGGTINGNCRAFLNQPHPDGIPWYQRAPRPAQMIYICECQNVSIHDLTITDSPYWHCFLHGTTFANLHDLTIIGDLMTPNNDGIDLDCCQFVTVANCNVYVGDDGITVRCDETRLKRKLIAQNITVTNCNIHSNYANALRVGVGEGTVRNCCFSNITVENTRTAVSVVSKYSDREDIQGGTLTEVTFTGLQIDARRLCNIKLDNSPAMVHKSAATIENIRFANIGGKVSLSSFVQGNAIGTIRNIDFDSIHLQVNGQGPHPSVDDKKFWGNDSTSAAFQINDAQAVDFSNVTLSFNDHPGWTQAVNAQHAKDVTIQDNCRLGKPSQLD